MLSVKHLLQVVFLELKVSIKWQVGASLAQGVGRLALMAKHGASYKNLHKMEETYTQYGSMTGMFFKPTWDKMLDSSTFGYFLYIYNFDECHKNKKNVHKINFYMTAIGKLWAFNTKIDCQFFVLK